MYTKENIVIKNIASKTSIKPELGSIAFYGNRTIATDSFRLVEVAADGESHDPVLYNAKSIQPSHVSKEGFNQDDLGLVPVEGVFPDVDQILNAKFKNEEYIEIAVNPVLLAETLMAMSKSGSEYVNIRVNSSSLKHEPLVIETRKLKKSTRSTSPKRSRSLVMPINT